MFAFGGDVAYALSGTKRSRRSLTAHYKTGERVNKEGRFPIRPFGNGGLETAALWRRVHNSISHPIINRLMSDNMNTISISRRDFARLLGAGAAAAFVRPTGSFAKQSEHIPASSHVVRLSANENSYGPSPKALKAMTDSFSLACRYPDEHNNMLIEKLAQLNNVDHDQILLGDGSSEILKLCAETFTGNEHRALVAADPTFEAILEKAKANGATVVKIPLTQPLPMTCRKCSPLPKEVSFTSATRTIPQRVSRPKMSCAISSRKLRVKQ